LALIFVKPGLGARRVAWATNNTLNVSRAALGAPAGIDLCKTGFRSSPLNAAVKTIPNGSQNRPKKITHSATPLQTGLQKPA
jgi:hypothetical protein